MPSKRILYLGLDPSRFQCEGELVHLPIIRIVPRPFESFATCFLEADAKASHILLTSRVAAKIYFEKTQRVDDRNFVCVGKATAQIIEEQQMHLILVADEETAEGVIALLETLKVEHLLFPRSSKGRSLIPEYLLKKKIAHTLIDLYDTELNPVEFPNLATFDEIVFTSPSTVQAFRELCPDMPFQEKYRALGPVTARALQMSALKNL